MYLKIEREEALDLNGEIAFETVLSESSRRTDTGSVIRIGEIRVYTDNIAKYSAGDKLRISGEIDEKGRVFDPEIVKVSDGSGISSTLEKFRADLSERVRMLLPRDEASLVSGMVLGVDEISPSFKENLIETGTIHTVVVSGQNLSIVAGFVLAAFAKPFGRRLATLLSIIAVIFYAVLTGFEPPVVRATVMVIIAAVALYLGREIIAVWGLFLTAFFILMLWPQALFEISFQLTFAATFGILTLGSYLTKRFQRSNRLSGFFKGFIDLFISNSAIAIAAYLFTLPLIFYHFGRISLIGPFVNVLVAEVVGLLMVIGFVVVFLSLVFMPLAQIAAYIAYIPALYFVKVVEIGGMI